MGAVTTIEDDLAISSAAVCGTFLDDFVPLRLLPMLLPVAAQVAWSCKAALKAAVVVQQRGGCHRAAQARLAGVSGGFGGAARLTSCRHPTASQLAKNASNQT